MQLGLPAILTILFVTLKLCNVIAWSWFWVLSPIWITLLVVVGLVVCAAIVGAKRGIW